MFYFHPHPNTKILEANCKNTAGIIPVETYTITRNA